MSTFNTSMFQSIKDALAKSDAENTPAIYNEVLKTTPGNTYTVRLLPFAKDPKNTFFHYFNHGWVSFATGQYVQALSPMTFGERDPIAEERFRILRMGTEDEKEKVKAIKRVEKYLVNVYVIDDPTNPDNNGKVKLLRFGRQLHKIIMGAIEGDEAEDLGPRIFDLSPKGCNLRIKVEKQGDYPTYVSSKFSTPKEIEGLDEDSHKKIYNSAFDLESYVSVKSYDELKDILAAHYYGTKDVEETIEEPIAKKTSVPTPAVNVAVKTTKPEAKAVTEDDESISELLKDL